MQNQKLIQLIERIVERRMLNESFKSAKMRELNQYVLPKLGYRGTIYDGNKLIPLLTAMNINASDVEDSDVYIGASGGVAYSKNNPKDAVIIVNQAGYPKNNYVAAILYGAKHVSLYSNYYSNATYSGTKDKIGAATSRVTDSRPTMRDKTGLSGEYSISNTELNDMKFFAIKNAEILGSVGYNDDYQSTLNPAEKMLDANRKRYAQKIKEMRAEKRMDAEYPDELISFAEQLLAVGSKIKLAMSDAIDNPSGQFVGSNSVSSYGKGRNRQTSYAPYIELYREAFKNITVLEKDYKEGKDYKKTNSWYYQKVQDTLSTLTKTFK